MVLSLVCLIAASTSSDSWIWWNPPTHFSQRDRLGYTDAQVLKMGAEKWSSLAYNSREKYYDAEEDRGDKSVPLAYTREGSTVVWAACLRDRNHELMSLWPAKKRETIMSLERPMFQFGMACIALENTLAGGGTYINHYPQFMWNNEERSLFSIIQGSPAPAVPTAVVELLNRRLSKYASLKRAPKRMLEETRASLLDIHQFARIALAEFAKTEKISKRLSVQQHLNVLAFEKEYLVDYLGIRGADGSPMKN